MTDLLNCPFCGGAMQLRYALWPSEGDRDAVIHNVPGGTSCPIEGAFSIDTFDNGVSVAEAWNRRPLLDELDASKARIAEGWMDIATAPKVDGGKCLLRVEHPNFAISHDPEWEAVVVAYWTDFNKGGWVWHGMLGTATHWLPHPEMPPHGDAK
jgi:hypothetical protein